MSLAPLQQGLLGLLLGAALYEPVRLALFKLGQGVGGVGGVGGLTNQWTCDERGPFGPFVCFRRGAFAGLTPFALVVLLGWTAPLAAAAAVGAFQARLGPRRSGFPEQRSAEGSGETPALRSADGFLLLWRALEALWLAVPLSYYLSDPFYHKSTWTVFLGCSLASAFPLSWHLSLVSIPGSSRLLALLANVDKQAAIDIHKAVAWSAVRWAVIHSLGQMAYMCLNPDGMCTFAGRIFCRRVAATPRPRRGYPVEKTRGGRGHLVETGARLRYGIVQSRDLPLPLLGRRGERLRAFYARDLGRRSPPVPQTIPRRPPSARGAAPPLRDGPLVAVHLFPLPRGGRPSNRASPRRRRLCGRQRRVGGCARRRRGRRMRDVVRAADRFSRDDRRAPRAAVLSPRGSFVDGSRRRRGRDVDLPW